MSYRDGMDAWSRPPVDAFHRAMRNSDRVYLNFLAKPMEERESLPIARKGLFKAKPKRSKK